MTPEPSTASAWDSMSDAEKVKWLATIMGWKELNLNGGMDEATGYFTPEWNPMSNWNHWRQVEEKVMEGDSDGMKIWKVVNYAAAPKGLNSWHTRNSAWWNYIKSDLPTRARALYLAYQSLR